MGPGAVIVGAMTDQESEFGGLGVNRSGVYPVPHIPNVHEQLRLGYRTGDPSGQTPPDEGQIWSGLRREEPMRSEMEASGKFDRGEYAADLMQDALDKIKALQDLAVPQ